MNQIWQRIASKIDGFDLRERVLIFLMVVVVLIMLVNVTLLDKQRSKEEELSKQIAQDQSQITGVQAEITSKVASYDRNPDAAKLAQFNQLKEKSEQMQTALQNLQKGLVSPDRMATLLDDILKQNGKLRLVSLHTLPVSVLNEADTAEDKANLNQSAAQKLNDKAANSAAGFKDVTPRGGLVYKHGVELVIEGDYFDMVNYMAVLEKMPWQLFWGKAILAADDSSKLNLTLTLYTLSLEKKWLNI
jgi:MSHA biogenesis protein MshJ